MVNGFRYYRVLESISMIASALSTALTVYPCQIRVHQRVQTLMCYLLPFSDYVPVHANEVWSRHLALVHLFSFLCLLQHPES